MENGLNRRRSAWVVGVGVGSTVLLGLAAWTQAEATESALSVDPPSSVRARGLPVPTGDGDFEQKGTQPNTVTDPVFTFTNCVSCHGVFDAQTALLPGRWLGSTHSHAARDPIFLAAVTIAEQDAPGAGQLCFRCHAPRAWLEGRVTTPSDTNGADFFASDWNEGVGCHFCHRTVDPVYQPGVSPPDDQAILDALAMAPGGSLVPTSPGNAQYVVDPLDIRRGPRAYAAPSPPHAWRDSAFHRDAAMCGQCHDVSIPTLMRQPDGSYLPVVDNLPHPTGDKFDMFPEQRTYSEWANSEYASTGVDLGGRFGGNLSVVRKCQDCHMPDVTAEGCSIGNFGTLTDRAYHSFQGANLHLIELLLELYQSPVGAIPALDFEQTIALMDAVPDVEYMLSNATDVELTQFGGELKVRVTNYCGHKLLTAYPEGRRIWVNVQFLDSGGGLIEERGAYDFVNADLTEDTKVYHAEHGIDSVMSGATGLPVGPSFHLALNNKIYFDNRIPPMGFTNAGFEAVQAEPVGYTYADGQHWDDTRFCIQQGTADVRVRLYYQTTSKEYIEFLRDANVTDSRGLDLYNAWDAVGRATPFAMDDVSSAINAFVPGDTTGEGTVDLSDLSVVLFNFGTVTSAGAVVGDVNCDGIVDLADLTVVLFNFGQSV